MSAQKTGLWMYPYLNNMRAQHGDSFRVGRHVYSIFDGVWWTED